MRVSTWIQINECYVRGDTEQAVRISFYNDLDLVNLIAFKNTFPKSLMSFDELRDLSKMVDKMNKEYYEKKRKERKK